MNPGQAVSFNGNSLQTSNIVVSQIDGLDDWPTLNAPVYPLAHANASAIPYEQWTNKVITLTGKVFGSSIANLDSNMNTFKGYLLGRYQNLDIAYNGSTVRYIATVTKTTVSRPQNLLFANFTVEFTATSPFGQDTTTTTAVNQTSQTASNYSYNYTFLGTAPYQLPIITITYTAIGSAPVAGTVIIGNAATGQALFITRTWSASDVLVIDATANTVTVNGLTVDFSGAFPTFPPGAGTLTYTDYFTSRSFTFNAVYYKAYL